MRVALPVVNFFSIWIRAPPGQSDGIRVLVAIKDFRLFFFRPFLIRYFHEWFSPGIGESSVPLFLLLMSGVRVRFLLLMCGVRVRFVEHGRFVQHSVNRPFCSPS